MSGSGPQLASISIGASRRCACRFESHEKALMGAKGSSYGRAAWEEAVRRSGCGGFVFVVEDERRLPVREEA